MGIRYLVGRYHCGAHLPQGWHEYRDGYDTLEEATEAFNAPMAGGQYRTYLYEQNPVAVSEGGYLKKLKMRRRRK